MLDLHRGRLSWRRLRVLIQHLPPESATMTALRNELSDEELAAQAAEGEPERARWSQQEQLLATVADAVRHLEYALICVNANKGAKRPDPPEPIRRPGAKPRKKTAKLTEGSANRLFDLIQGGAA
ncbi:hypothetical protein [Streptomyces sp. MJP52]|uniref:hypothetical protein n=1 Tax=Streptomyces sp. MJP52 TaxID=2940555 RepID=UPI0024745C47|nr:hypothetical protein [Streptomyces sp. MJP52]MDH6224364.1 hypothetical protein [Streptomyces sp. MJP52]